MIFNEDRKEYLMVKPMTGAPSAALGENKMGVMPIGKLLYNMALPMISSMMV